MFGPLLFALFVSIQPPGEVIADIQVHGNVLTPEAEIIQLAQVQVGMPFTPDTPELVAARLRAVERFARIDVQKRFASIADPTKIALVILVDEGPVKVEQTGDPAAPIRLVRSRGPGLLFGPVFEVEDGYGVTYGVRVAKTGLFGRTTRVSLPFTWGGTKRAALETDIEPERGPIARVQVGASISRRENPFFEQDDDRVRTWIRGEKQLTTALRITAAGGWQRVSFAERDDRFAHVGGDVVFDTRVDPMLSRDAVYARAGWERFGLSGGAVARAELELRGYVGLPGQSILVARGMMSDARDPLPPYLQPLLGGMSNLRGFGAGTAAGDNLAATSLEVRVPLTSPLSVGKLGVSAFLDAAAVYDEGARLADQRLRRGGGGALWFSAAFVRFSIAVARGAGGSTHVHVGTGMMF